MTQYQPPNQEQPYPPSQPYQQPPQGYPPQGMPQGYPQMNTMPPRKKSRKGLWISLAVVLVVIIIIAVIASAASGGGSPSTASTNTGSSTTGSTTSSQNTPSSNGSSNSHTVGQPVPVSDTWTVTVNSVKLSSGSEFDAPKSGNTFLVVNVTLKNTSSSTQNVSSLDMFSLKDSTGQTYDQDIAAAAINGNVAAGELLRGNLTFEVPKSVHTFTFQFASDLGGSDLTEWTVKD